ncbi:MULTISPECIES: ectoine hydroxylase [Amycolatopsis]|uniref:Ectoine hydroxylase n=1 Tax=Amycolatopsis keratiniphila subsp. keratiniphila TaxID=227715 RepID=A0A1W2LN98_9PSEU|nr:MULTISPECIES: ectoine hydroxylase [Amycolatopsis]OLZ52137.1 ectoine hydroxylase [Amycolatopsis keratiniphila subsp. nogabecina]ONF64449.1 ectoine hydroxylase [Amycolatopsis keratiniphila subsp. keratiniphila]UMP05633.1 ectoine hydroxylase [Amycolatopsis sp. EV170708-02-1]SDU60613.1 ectoine hydroxylase [Amycolatopsis keratiniphila]
MTLTDTRVDDSYPTRITGKPEHLPRTHPTVWGTEADGPLDAATLANHETRGYTVVDQLLSPGEVQTYWQELVRMSSGDHSGDERVITEAKTGEVRSIFDVHETSELIAELVRDPRVLDRARQILGSEVYIHQSRVNYMPGFKGTGFYWHSDFETWHAEDGMPVPRAVSCSIALTDNYPFNGGLMVMPGSQRTFVQCAGETPEDNYKSSLKEQRVGVPSEEDITALAAEYGIDQFTGQAGSALWFDSNVMHGSSNNITPYPRSNIFVVFNSVENALQEPYAAIEPRPAFIAGRDSTPLTR